MVETVGCIRVSPALVQVCGNCPIVTQGPSNGDAVGHDSPKGRMRSAILCRVRTATSGHGVHMVGTGHISMAIARVQGLCLELINCPSLRISISKNRNSTECDTNLSDRNYNNGIMNWAFMTSGFFNCNKDQMASWTSSQAVIFTYHAHNGQICPSDHVWRTGYDRVLGKVNIVGGYGWRIWCTLLFRWVPWIAS
jgi:hypothetical protein